MLLEDSSVTDPLPPAAVFLDPVKEILFLLQSPVDQLSVRAEGNLVAASNDQTRRGTPIDGSQLDLRLAAAPRSVGHLPFIGGNGIVVDRRTRQQLLQLP